MRRHLPPFTAAALALLALAACSRPAPTGWQGYLEGDFVYIASPLAGRLETLAVVKGARVAAHAPLFTLERGQDLAAQRQAADQLRAAQARLADLQKGSRPSELGALEARLAQARASTELSKLELARQENLFKTNVIAAAEAEASAAAAAKDRADWNVTQKSPSAPRAALVYDTLYREGEFVAAGLPVLALLPPENIKVRFYVSDSDFAALKAGDTVRVALTGHAPLAARISYLSPKPEYTPPVLYNRENRAKLVWLVEAVFTDPSVTRDLHPGQPVDVQH